MNQATRKRKDPVVMLLKGALVLFGLGLLVSDPFAGCVVAVAVGLWVFGKASEPPARRPERQVPLASQPLAGAFSVPSYALFWRVMGRYGFVVITFGTIVLVVLKSSGSL